MWRAPLDSSGDWFDADLWTNGVPDADTATSLINGSEARIDSGQAEALSLSFQLPRGGRSRLTQTGGSLQVTQAITLGDGVYRQIGGELSAETLSLPSLSFISFAPDVYEQVPLPPGANPFVVTNVWRPVPWPPVQSVARFELAGGVAEFRSGVNVNTGRVVVSGGRLETATMLVDAPLTPSLFTDSFLNNGVTQSGGEVVVEGELQIQDGQYALSGGSLTVGRLIMGDPTNPFFSTWSSATRRPEFVQTGGSVVVQDDFELCMPFIGIGGSFFFPRGPRFEDVTYRLEGGTLDVAGDATVGSMGLAPVRFLQSGGVHTTAGTLRIEGEESRYEFSGGELSVGVLEIGVDAFNTGGTLAIGAGRTVNVDDRVTLGEEAVIEAEPDATIALDGGAFEIEGRDTRLLAGLENLTLLITGGDELSTLEAAAVDIGDLMGGFENNFAWGTLQIGDEDETGHLTLIDLVDNAPAATPEAVYVDRLVVGEGSTLDLGGLNLYYRELVMLGEVTASSGSLRAVAVPEPAGLTLALAVFMAAGCGRRRSVSGGR